MPSTVLRPDEFRLARTPIVFHATDDSTVKRVVRIPLSSLLDLIPMADADNGQVSVTFREDNDFVRQCSNLDDAFIEVVWYVKLSDNERFYEQHGPEYEYDPDDPRFVEGRP